MRPAMIATVLVLSAALPACGGNGGSDPGPERRSAAGQVLGGEASDAMVPLDTVQSTSPVAPRPAASGTGAAKTTKERRDVLPEPEVSGGPEPLPADPGADDAPSPPQE
ncbi:MAG TPA: hypothetical protein VFS87_10240 [Qipengyuania sp.]|nr:hypothetical protein [Qipengyuania sp.]